MKLPAITGKWLPALLTLVALLMAGGCMNEPAEERKLHAPSPETEKEDTLLTFGILYPMAHPFYEMITQLTEESADPLGISLIVKAPDEVNLEQQIRMMEQMIKQRVDGIAVSPVDGEALGPVIDRAIDAGIPVICFETDSPGSKRLSYIGADHAEGGKLVGKALGELLKGRGMVLVEHGFADMPAQKQRLDGMLQYIDSNTDIQVLDIRYNSGSESQALADLETMIDSHPHFDAFVSLDLWSASSSILVWKAMGLDRDVIAFGMQTEIKEAILNGQMTSVVSQNEQEWGHAIIQSLMTAVQKKPLPDWVDTGSRVLIRETVDSFPDISRSLAPTSR
ncbi:sugar ABC transporter substrate-binding protein [Paenibacillus nanensis]|uniref:Sugar ABC transporter substrate-binding protein n=1 Tax=Paenibacillus nanensis TaxID=393251 RepID=A0A3A1UUR3_9BACL|nr:substrate-binding domain-containing protein [Paenibacillus nanensis]RIX50003.1 sugar ABC transporter substrate-binding protein [Paenibacillus nanensis]